VATKKASSGLKSAEKAFASAALAYTGVVEEAPWGHRAFKVNKKTFLFMGVEENHLGLSTKLPHSGAVALELSFAEPTGYGLGKSGWVSSSFKEGDDIPVSLLLEWIDESYRAIAPKKLVASLGQAALAKASPAPRKTPAKKTPAKQTPAKQTPAKQTPAKQTPAKQTLAKKTPAKKAPTKKTRSR
jgi:predicted DNA-binding protein (MmcQ/YjbR family)